MCIRDRFNPDQNETNSTLIWSIDQEPDAQSGTIMIESYDSSAMVHFQPEGNYSGMAYFSVKVSEYPDSNASDIVNISVEVESIEDTPIFESYPQSLDAIEGYSWQYEIFAVDGDTEQTLVISSDNSLPPWLTLISISEGSSILYGTPVIGQAGTYPISLSVTDGNGNSSSQEFTLNVLDENIIDLSQSFANADYIFLSGSTKRTEPRTKQSDSGPLVYGGKPGKPIS